MPRPLSPAEVRAAVAELREAARVAKLEALAHETLADLIEAEHAKGLTISADRAINRHMAQANPLDVLRSNRSPGRGRVSAHPFPKALERANITMTEMAKLLDEHRSTVKSWLTRKIPRERAEAIAKLIDLPANDKSWPAGIKG